jgi:hypothetical protein
MNVVNEAALAVDFDHRDPFAVLRLELRIVVDRDFAQLEACLLPHRGHHAAGCITEMAARRGVENYVGYG